MRKEFLPILKGFQKNARKKWLTLFHNLEAKEELEATKEIINDKDILKSIMQGDEDFRVGRVKKWSEVREGDFCALMVSMSST